jgi:ubiquinone biosynthesis protein COQ4
MSAAPKTSAKHETLGAGGAVASLDSLRPAVPRPVQWKRLYDQLVILWEAEPAKVLDAAYSTGDSIGGMSGERLINRVLASAEGRALYSRQSSLTDALADHDALQSLPEGSLGRAFLAFSERHGLDPRALIEKQHEMSRDYTSLDPVRQWFSDRFTVMHDLWHVLSGYDATHSGESALMCFSLPQRVNDRAIPIFILMSLLAGRIAPRDAREAIRRGNRAKLLAGEPVEDLLPLPLAEARERLGISDPHTLHPLVPTEGMLIPSTS